jgi:hypothetical protein
MKTIRHCWFRTIALSVLFALDLQFDSCHADPLSSWNEVSSSPFPITSMAYGNGTFVGGGRGWWAISHDGSNWQFYVSPPIISGGGVAYGNGMFLAFGTNNERHANYILQSTKGTTWSTIYTSSNNLNAAAYGNNTWVFVGNNNEIVTANVTSTNWNWTEFQPGFWPCCLTYGNGVFVIGATSFSFGGTNYSIFSSSDGITWQYDFNGAWFVPGDASHFPIYFQLYPGIVYGNGVFVAPAQAQIPGNPINLPISVYGVAVSSNLVNWTFSGLSGIETNYSSAVAFGGNQFIACLGGSIYTSPDGYTWTNNLSEGPDMGCFTYGQGTFVATDGSGTIYQSGVFANQSNSPATTLGISTYPGVTINGTAGAVYQIQYSTDLNTWQTLTNFMLPYSPYLWFDTSSIVSGQRFYRSVQLQ